jgi:hypothetical protein
MPSRLRHIAVSVEEGKPQRFHWVLMEAEADSSAWAPLQRAATPLTTYREAMAGGLMALQAMTEDLDRGPWMAPEDDQELDREDEGAPETPGRKAYFGFGPAR